MSTVAFCPWLRISAPCSFGPIEATSYQRGTLPGPTGSALQQTLDAVMEPYLAFGTHSIEHATLFKLVGNEITADLNDDQVDDIFYWLEIFSFAGLSRREYFLPGSARYWNRDNFTIIVQHFDDPTRGVAITIRRRDGGARHIVTRGAFYVKKPDHVSLNQPVTIDEQLLNSLVSASGNSNWPKYQESIVNYNIANTDNGAVPERLEAVLLVGAFETLLESPADENKLLRSFLLHFRPTHDIPPTGCARLTASADITRRFSRCTSVREAWLRDFVRLRHDPAHGRSAGHYPSAWSLKNHLLLASLAFPLVCKLSLSNDGVYTISRNDELYTEAFEPLACEEHFPTLSHSGQPAAWTQVLGDLMLRFI